MSLLRRALYGNALFSLGTALVALVAAGPLGRIFDVPAWWSVLAGGGLVTFGAGVWRLAHGDEMPHRAVRVVIAADLAWIAGAAVLLAVPGTIPGEGKAVLAAVTIVVGLWAALQAAGLRRATGS